MTEDDLADLRQRIRTAMQTLDAEALQAADEGRLTDAARLVGKRQGLALAKDYLRAYAPAR